MHDVHNVETSSSKLLNLNFFKGYFLRKLINKSDFNFEKDLLNQARVMEAARRSNQKRRSVKISEIK